MGLAVWSHVGAGAETAAGASGGGSTVSAVREAAGA